MSQTCGCSRVKCVCVDVQDIDFASKDKVMRLLDQAAASLDGSTGEDLGPAFKRYRQAVFKLNYKINKLKDNKKGGNVRPMTNTLSSGQMDFCMSLGLHMRLMHGVDVSWSQGETNLKEACIEDCWVRCCKASRIKK